MAWLLAIVAAGVPSPSWPQDDYGPTGVLNKPVDSEEQGRGRQASAAVASDEQPAVRPRVVVMTGQTALDTAWVEQIVAGPLSECGFQVLDYSELDQADFVVAVWPVARAAGSWGGMPRQQVGLVYAMLDPRKHLRLGADTAWGSYADHSPESATLGALKAAAGVMAQEASTRMVKVPTQPTEIPGTRSAEPESSAVLSMAALPFHNATNRSNLDGWCECLAGIAVQELQKTRRYRILERARLPEVIKETDFVAASAGNNQLASQIGRELSADLLLVGEVALRPDGELEITARLVRVRDMEVRQVIHVTGPEGRATKIERDFRRQLVNPIDDWIADQLDQLRQAPVLWPDAGSLQ